MKGKYALILAFLFLLPSELIKAQDIGISSIISPPTGGCNLGTQNVQMYLYNFSAFPLGGTFNVSYTVNGGPPVNETVVTSIGPSASYLFTFATQANLNNSGTYTICASVNLAGDINPANDNLCITVVNDTTVVGGTISGPTAVCASGNSGVLTLNGNNGYITDWEFSTDGGVNWNPTGVNSQNYNFSNITQTTIFRVNIDGGFCPDNVSAWHTINVDLPTSAGTLVGGTTVCALGNSGQVNLAGFTGNIFGWEYSTDGGVNWNPIVNNTSQENYLNLVTTTQYRVTVQNGTCPSVLSNTVTVTVSDTTEGGIVNLDMPICSGNSDTLALTNNVGSVQFWMSSTNGGATWNNISTTNPTYIFPGLTQTTLFTAVVQSGVCPADTALPALVTVYTTAVGGFLGSSDTVCEGATGTLNLSGNTGAVNTWITSTDGGSSWNPLAITDSSYTYSSISQSTIYAVVVSNPGCPADTSELAVITVDSPSNAGSISVTSPVCQNSSGSLNLSGYNGDIQFWSYSNNGGTTWNTAANTTPTQNYTNIQVDRIYAVVVQNGVCPPDTAFTTITVLPSPIANAGNDTSIYMGDMVQLFGSGGLFYVWTPGGSLDDPNIINPVASPTVTTTYTLTVTDVNNCTGTDQVIVTVIDTTGVFEPLVTNLLSPNGDGLNDVWNIIGVQNFPNTDVMVWNNHGQIVYDKKAYDNSWKGDYNGDQLPDGSYFYVVKANDIDRTYKGILTIVRSR